MDQITPNGPLALGRNTEALLTQSRGFQPAAAPRGVAITLRGVGRRFGANTVLHELDLDVPAGQFLAIVGRSGCGKSTLLRLLAGLDRPDSGSIDFRGPDGAAVPVSAGRLMFQEPRLLPWASIAANVEVGLSHERRADRRRALALAALEEVGLAGRGDEWPAVLSGGQKQRTALARALIARPPLLLLDEPLGALDALTRIEMQSLVEQVWRGAGVTAVLVTHDVSEAAMLADRIILLEAGRVALDLAVDRPRPRHHGDPALAAVEGRVLDHLFGRH
ncbi:ATP-binding cassette domain-containing protein [Roseomonas sp. NAR14]|uniref:ATP-binding cassette domain-containing protein n=1 Tax=Roseomonas acroporae TaxID=2937791 RepID=A0A9X1Y4X9_9PROT|nr:ATP-binding cassette domain-containing protein [Roseomonas acroporae]MCK8783576.1 ATP-binding cassette domain-containing protein [Roseomonas acroporae]